MKKLATCAVLFALAFGIAAGLTAVSTNAATYYCRAHEDQYVCTFQTGPLCPDPEQPYYYQICDGVHEITGEPCHCHWIGCCSDPF
jgi:hypothetical protein